MAAIVAVAVIWGVTFTVVDDLVADLPPADLVAWRFGIAAAIICFIRNSGPSLKRDERLRAILLGILLGGGFLLQTWALTDTDALQSGFLTSLLVVLAPMMAWLLFRESISGRAWLAVAVAVVGVGFLSYQQTGFGKGELLTMGAATLWALHVVLLSRWARPGQAVELARIQTVVVAVMGLVAVAVNGIVTGSPKVLAIPQGTGQWLGVLFLALFSTAIAMVLLSWGQSRLSATRVAVILTLEPAVGAVTAVLSGTAMTGRVLIGGSLLLIALLILEARSGTRPVKRQIEPSTAVLPQQLRSNRSSTRVPNSKASTGTRSSTP